MGSRRPIRSARPRRRAPNVEHAGTGLDDIGEAKVRRLRPQLRHQVAALAGRDNRTGSDDGCSNTSRVAFVAVLEEHASELDTVLFGGVQLEIRA